MNGTPRTRRCPGVAATGATALLAAALACQACGAGFSTDGAGSSAGDASSPADDAGSLGAGGADDSSVVTATAIPAVERGSLAGFNVLLVTVDTLRADVLGAYGGPAGLTPNIDRLANEGVRFASAFAHAAMTLPSHASILTGQYPFRHGVRANGTYRLDESRQTLAEMLADAGYRTGAFVGAFVLDTRFGLAQGFETYDDYYGESATQADFNFQERPAESVLGPAAAWIARDAETPWFAWVHLFDPHLPYAPPEPYLRGRRAKPYEAEVAYVDDALGGFLERLAETGELDDTLVVFTADHGESLGEHGERTHGAFAYNATLRVPLIFWTGSMPSAAVVEGPVGHVDIVPTVLDSLGLPGAAQAQGASLLATHAPHVGGVTAGVPDAGGAAAGAESLGAAVAPADRPIYFEALDGYFTQALAPLTGVVTGDYKFIELPIRELYHLPTDPDERNNIAASEPSIVARSRALLEESLEAVGTPEAQSPALAGLIESDVRGIDDSVRSGLAALGYVAADAVPARRKFMPADDPKLAIASIEKQRSAAASFSSGRPEEAIRMLREVIDERPAAAAASAQLASILFQIGRLEEAVAVLETALRDHPLDVSIAGKLGFYLAVSGQTDRAGALLETALERSPENIDFLEGMAIVHSTSGRLAAARALLERGLQIDPSSASLYHNLGLTRAREGELEVAIEHFRRAIELAPEFWFPYEGLGSALAATDRLPEAVEAWVRLVELNPRHLDAIYNLGIVLVDLGRNTEALVYLDRYLAEAPPGAADVERVRALAARIRGRS